MKTPKRKKRSKSRTKPEAVVTLEMDGRTYRFAGKASWDIQGGPGSLAAAIVTRRTNRSFAFEVSRTHPAEVTIEMSATKATVMDAK